MIYIGIDPGMSGCCVALRYGDVLIHPNDNEYETWEWIKQFAGADCRAAIELQTARPVLLPRKMRHGKMEEARSTVLASTVKLFGNYRDLRTMLLCAGIQFEDCPPKRWQEALAVPNREKGQKDNAWKNVLKARAIELFPNTKVTLASADALLIATYVMMQHG